MCGRASSSNRVSVRLALFVSAISAFLQCSADGINKWVDENGRIHFGDKVPAEYRDVATAVELKSINIVSVANVPSGLSQGGRVVLYATEWCPHCKRAKKYFGDNGIAYTERDVEKSTAAKREFKKLGGKGVPLILVGEQMMRGFSETRFRALYNKKPG